MTVQSDVMYYTACADCGVAVSNVRVRQDADFLDVQSRVACSDCYAEWKASKDREASSKTDTPADATGISVSAGK